MLLPLIAMILAHVSPCAALLASQTFQSFAGTVNSMQSDLISKAKLVDPTAKWTIDEHERGRAAIIEDGDVWEKGACCTSA